MKLVHYQLKLFLTHFRIPGLPFKGAQLQSSPINNRPDIVVATFNFVACRAQRIGLLSVVVIEP